MSKFLCEDCQFRKISKACWFGISHDLLGEICTSQEPTTFGGTTAPMYPYCSRKNPDGQCTEFKLKKKKWWEVWK